MKLRNYTSLRKNAGRKKTSQGLGHFCAARFFSKVGRTEKKVSRFFQKVSRFFQKVARFFSKTTCFAILTHHSSLITSSGVASVASLSSRARKDTSYYIFNFRMWVVLVPISDITDPTPAPSPTREGSGCRLARSTGLRRHSPPL